MPVRLKSLELQGYKTFATRTVFEFAESITAIVGPNGSGKSNIADALRWVLGEQSYSLLRGKKTEDMIFAGSEERPRASMASASVIFDNSDNWLPIDFSEVAVARRAYRDGQNEYLLNGQRVRLRDVSELLSDSGLAERTYTIIGQGLVDAALALKAEERRRLFEEAAGIGLHRSRREEALRRLDTTRRNLERVQDILAELQPRLRSLERQARRAEEYEQIKSDLQQVLREWYGYHWHRGQRDLREARDLARRQEIALDSARQAQANYHQKLKTVRNRIQNLRTELSEYHHKLAGLHNEREDVSRQIAVVEARNTSLEEQRKTVQSDISRAHEEIGLQQNRLDQIAQEIAFLEEEKNKAEIQAQTAKEAFESRQIERSQRETELQSTRQELSRLTNSKSQFETMLSERRNQIERFRSSSEEVNEACLQASLKVEKLEEKVQEKKKNLEEAERVRVQAEAALKEHHEKMSRLESLQKEIAAVLSSQQTRLARLGAQQEVLDQAEQALDGYASGARVLIQAARHDRLKGAQNTLSNLLEVPAELETPIAAALGEFLDSILLQNGANPDEALEILERQTARGALLPLDSLRPSLPLVLNGNPSEGVIGVGAKLVKVTPELQSVVDLLLGQVLVVKDRQAARRALEALQKEGPVEHFQTLRVVTLNGEIFHGGGQILAGSEGKPTTLSRSRQKRELAQSMTETHHKIDSLERQADEIEAKYAQLQEQSIDVKRAFESRVEEEERKRHAHRQELVALEQAKREVGWQEQRQQQIQVDISLALNEISLTEKDVRQLQGKISHLNEVLKEKAAALADLPIEEFQSRVSHWEKLLAVANRALAEGRTRLEDRRSTFENAQQVLLTYQNRLREIEAEVESLVKEKATLRQSEIEIGRRIEEVSALINPTEEKLSSLENEQDKLLNSEGEAQDALNQAEHRNAQAKINLARKQEALETLRRRIEDDFGLVDFEYEEDISGPNPLPFEGLVEKLPAVSQLSTEVEEMLKRQRAHLRRMGPINPEAMKEHREVKKRFQFLTDQVEDLVKAETDILKVIKELDALMEREFLHTFEKVAGEFRQIFGRLFGGGSAKLILTDPQDLSNTGIDIEARLPGRREQGLSLLSGGERSLTATALVFALLRVSPTPFCVLDEVDAMLDEINVGRFRDLLRELSQFTQFVIITHNRNTVQVADVIYGVTMRRDSTSRVISLKLDEVSQVIG